MHKMKNALESNCSRADQTEKRINDLMDRNREKKHTLKKKEEIRFKKSAESL